MIAVVGHHAQLRAFDIVATDDTMRTNMSLVLEQELLQASGNSAHTGLSVGVQCHQLHLSSHK